MLFMDEIKRLFYNEKHDNEENHSLQYSMMMDPLQKIRNLKENDKTEISIVFNNLTETTHILRVCKNRNLSEVCEKLKSIKNPNVAFIYDYIYENGNTYIIEEYISGETVEDIIEHKGVFSEDETARIIINICNALEIFHHQNPPVIHNDIKPSNIMIREDGTVKLFDFDISRTYKEGNTQNTTLFGTEEYASPEHFGFGQTDPRSDVYSLGVTMHKMLTNEVLSSSHGITYNGKLKAVLKKCTEADSKNRYSSVKELKRDLERFLSRENHLRVKIAIILAMPLILLTFGIIYSLFNNSFETTDADNRNLEIKQKLVGVWQYQGDKEYSYLVDTLVFNPDGRAKNTAIRLEYIGTYDVIDDSSIKLTFTSNSGSAPPTEYDINGVYAIDDFSVVLKYDKNTNSIIVPTKEYEEFGYFEGSIYSMVAPGESFSIDAMANDFTLNGFENTYVSEKSNLDENTDNTEISSDISNTNYNKQDVMTKIDSNEESFSEDLTYDVLINQFEEYVQHYNSLKFISANQFVSPSFEPYVEFKSDGTYLFYLVYPESVYELEGVWRKEQEYIFCELSRDTAVSLGIYNLTFEICDGYVKFLSDSDLGWSKIGDTFWPENRLAEGKTFEKQKITWLDMSGEYIQQVIPGHIPNSMYFYIEKLSDDPYFSIATYRGGHDISETALTIVSDTHLFYSNGGGYRFDIFVIDEYTFEIKNDTWDTKVNGIYKKSLYEN